MDRNTVIGFILIGLVLMLWMYLNAPPPPPPRTAADSTAAAAKSPAAQHEPAAGAGERAVPQPGADAAMTGQAQSDPDSLGRFFSPAAKGLMRTFTGASDPTRVPHTTLG